MIEAALPQVWVVLTAAGSGSRLGFELPKALVPLQGISILERALGNLAAVKYLAGVVVTAPAHSIQDFAQVRSNLSVPTYFVPGGNSRQASVAEGVAEVARHVRDANSNPADLADPVVLIHDAARCLMPAEVFDRVADHVRSTGHATIAALPVVDTIKAVYADKGQQVQETLDRGSLRIVQTPQGFHLSQIQALHQQATDQAASEITAATDDAGLAEVAGYPVQVVEGDPLGLKITTPADLRYAEFLVNHNLLED